MDTEEIGNIISALRAEHPHAVCELDYTTPFELLVAVILSAQCTDKRVNMVTHELFKRYNTPSAIATMDDNVLREYIHPCGFFNSKAKSLIECSQAIMDKFQGEVPSTMEELMTLSGVGRKTANVILSNIFHVPALAVDTHVRRLANRIGFVDSDDVLVVERALMEQIPKENWSEFHHLLIHHGRYTCIARAPKCQECSINKFCKFYLSR